MIRRTIAAAAIGSLAGAFLGLIAVAAGAARLVDGGLIILEKDGGASEAVVAVSQAGLYLFVAASGVVAGAIFAMIGYAVGTQADPGATRYRLGPIVALGAGVGAAVAFAATRAVLGLTADIVDKTVLVSGFRAGVSALVAGAATGMVVAATAERLSRPEAIGFEGAAVPHSFGRFVRDAAAAVGLPAIGLGVAAIAVFGLSRVLLEAEGNVALLVFGGTAAAVLFGTALLASLPRRKR